jgi:hypothetical protein
MAVTQAFCDNDHQQWARMATMLAQMKPAPRVADEEQTQLSEARNHSLYRRQPSEAFGQPGPTAWNGRSP